jgi:enoyl-CoA hydratase
VIACVKSAFHRSVINGEMFNPQICRGRRLPRRKVVSAEELQGAALAAARQLKKINMTPTKTPN